MNTHASTQSLLPLQEPPPDARTFLNSSVWFVDSDGYRVIFRWHEPLYRVALSDEVHLRLVAVSLRQSQLGSGLADGRDFGLFVGRAGALSGVASSGAHEAARLGT